MLSTYCQHCGSKNEYRFNKPKFCSNCGQPLAGEAVTPKQTIKPKKKQVSISQDLDEDGTDIYEVPEITSLAYEIDVSNHGNFNLGSLFGNQPIESQQPAPKPKRGRPRKNNGAKKKS